MYKLLIVRVRGKERIPVQEVGEYEDYREAERAGRSIAEDWSRKYRDEFSYEIRSSV